MLPTFFNRPVNRVPLLIAAFFLTLFSAVSPQQALAAGHARVHHRAHSALRVGDTAPNFTLNWAGRQGAGSLIETGRKQPVVLIFGSYT